LNKRVGLFAVLALVFISLVLRPPLAAIGPLLQEITLGLNLDVAQQSLLTSIPVFCFGLGAFLTPWLMRRFGLTATMMMLLLVLLMSLVGRVLFGYDVLLIGTVFAGLAIAVANVLLPTLVRVDFANRASLMTSVYTTLLAISASGMAAGAVLLSHALGGWQHALLLTAIPAALAIIFWIPRFQEPHVRIEAFESRSQSRAVHRSPLAWSILGFFGIQSLGFYVLLGWLPSILIDSGVTPAAAGGFLGLATAVGIPSGFALAPLISRLKSLSWMIAVASSLTALGYLILAVLLLSETVKTSPLMFAVCILISVGQTATFPMSLSLIATRANSQEQTTALSAFSQGWGYLIAGLGTFAFGAIAAALQSWTAVVFAIVALTVLQAAIGIYAGRDAKVARQ
jgi:CP family cyanate transporter-like MFS transporter